MHRVCVRGGRGVCCTRCRGSDISWCVYGISYRTLVVSSGICVMYVDGFERDFDG